MTFDNFKYWNIINTIPENLFEQPAVCVNLSKSLGEIPYELGCCGETISRMDSRWSVMANSVRFGIVARLDASGGTAQDGFAPFQNSFGIEVHTNLNAYPSPELEIRGGLGNTLRKGKRHG